MVYGYSSSNQQSSLKSKSKNDAVLEAASSSEEDDFEEVNRTSNKSSDTDTTNYNSNENSKINDSGIMKHRRAMQIDNRKSENNTSYEDDEGANGHAKKLQDRMTENEMREEAEMWKGVGNRHMASQEYSKAYTAYSTSLSLSPLGPSSHIYLSNRAAALLSLKRYSAASVDARRAITLAPTFGKAHARLGQSLYFLHDYAGAVRAYEDAFTYEPENEITWTYLNKARRKLERKKGISVAKNRSGRKNRLGTIESDTIGATSITADEFQSACNEEGNDMISVTDSINLKNMKITDSITVDDAANKKSINAAIMKDQFPDNKIDAKEEDDGFYEDIFDLSLDRKDLNLKDTMQKALAKPHHSYRDNRKSQTTSRHSYQRENEYNEFARSAIECNDISNTPTDEAEEISVSVSQQETNRQTHQPVSQYSSSCENENENCTTSSDPDFDEALKIQKSASTHLLHRRYKIAVEEFSAALFLVPDDNNLTPSLFVGRAYALNGQGRHLSAQNDAMMALGRRPDLVDGHVALARSLFYAGDFRGAVRSFENASACLQRNFGDSDGIGSGSGLSKLDQLYFEKARAGLTEKEKGWNEDDDKSHGYSILSGSNKPVPKLKPPRFVPREESSNSVTSMPKAWSNQVPQSLPSLRVGPERCVIFFSHCLGIKLNRGSDGIIRVVSVTEDNTLPKAPSEGIQVSRQGHVESGDVVREAAGVDLRRPINKFMWSDTVSLLKVSPRPVKLIVSKELSDSPLGFTNEVSKSMAQAAMGLDDWGDLHNEDVDNDGEEDKREITRTLNMLENYAGPKRPLRSGGTESVAETVHDMTMDEDLIHDNVALSQEGAIASKIPAKSTTSDVTDHTSDMTHKMDEEKDVDVFSGKTETSAKDDIKLNKKKGCATAENNDCNSSLVESATVVKKKVEDVQQNQSVTSPDLSNFFQLETAEKEKNSTDMIKKECLSKVANNIDMTTGEMVITKDNEVLGQKLDVENDNNIESEIKPIPEVVEDSTETIEDLTSKISISIEEITKDDSTRKMEDVKSGPESPISKNSLDGLSFSPRTGTTSVAESEDERTNFTDLSYEEKCSDSRLGIGMLDTLLSPCGKGIDFTEGLVNDEPLNRKEILFIRPEKDSHSSSSSSSPTLGWTNDLWRVKASQRVLVYSRHVQLLTKGRFFWSADQYVPRALALFTNPDLILVLRPPLNVSEVKESLNIPDELDLSSKRSDTNLTDLYWVAERVIDLKTCKLRLSQLTTPTSVVVQDAGGIGAGGDISSENEDDSNADCKRATCFELINPFGNVLVSAVVISPSVLSGNDTQLTNEELNSIYTGKSAMSVTSWWESAIAKALYTSHAPHHLDGSTDTCSDKSWKHQIVLGSLHSHVVSGSHAALQKAIEIIKKDCNTNSNPNFAPKEISLDGMDEYGMTPLHYACNSRSSAAVSMLVKAGADCTIPTKSECKTPCHLSAELLDQTSISVILAASKPRRPDPNALDSYGQTPMYIAAVHGRSVTSGPDQLRKCLLALEAWGGQLYLLPNVVAETKDIIKRKRTVGQKSKLSAIEKMSTATNQVKVMPHPIHSVSANWRHAELNILFAFCPHRYPIDLEGQFGFGRSLGALFDYPLHACAISLRKKLIEFKQKRRSDMFGQAKGEPSLITTLRVLLNHGLEPNERLEYINSATQFAMEMNEMTGLTPVQILAAAALDITSDRQNSKEKGLDADPCLDFVSFYIAESVELLVQHGARISVDYPPLARPNRENPLQDLVVQLLRGGMTNLPTIDREKLSIEKNSDLIVFFGGKTRLSQLRTKWCHAKAVKAPPGCKIRGKEFPTSVPDFDLPGGSDSTNCAICWKIFGLLRNRKHICRLSRRYVCEDCSSKSVSTMDGDGIQSHRISDGQYTYSKFCSEKQREQDRIESKERINARKLRIEQLQNKSNNIFVTGKSMSAKTTETAEREEIFLGSAMGRAVKNFFTDGGSGTGITIDTDWKNSARSRTTEKSAENQIEGITSSLNQTKDSLNERGERLNTLSDKTRALKDASSDFARMAKELNKKSQNSGVFW